eukprot:scaffold50471_cov62-Phaeocystis_antarctica.AAC.2
MPAPGGYEQCGSTHKGCINTDLAAISQHSKSAWAIEPILATLVMDDPASLARRAGKSWRRGNKRKRAKADAGCQAAGATTRA